MTGAILAACKKSPLPNVAIAPPQKLEGVVKSSFTVDEPINSLKDITTYNNFYEFGTDKSDPAANAHKLITRPWTVAVEGEVMKPKTFDIDELLKLAPLEERVYRFRCVEAWSMVIPSGRLRRRTHQPRRADIQSQVCPIHNAA